MSYTLWSSKCIRSPARALLCQCIAELSSRNDADIIVIRFFGVMDGEEVTGSIVSLVGHRLVGYVRHDGFAKLRRVYLCFVCAPVFQPYASVLFVVSGAEHSGKLGCMSNKARRCQRRRCTIFVLGDHPVHEQIGSKEGNTRVVHVFF